MNAVMFFLTMTAMVFGIAFLGSGLGYCIRDLIDGKSPWFSLVMAAIGAVVLALAGLGFYWRFA